MDRNYTLSIYAENRTGLLNRIALIFNRRHIHISSFNMSCESERKEIYRYTLLVKSNSKQLENVIRQLEKIVDVFKAFYHPEEEIIMHHIELKVYLKKLKILTNKK